MKVDIITRHAPANYGSLLQSYATQEILKKMGYESEIINYVRYEERGKNKAKTLMKNSKLWNKNIITRFFYKVVQTPNYNHMYKKFKKFRNELLIQTKEYGDFEELKNDYPIADVYCSGSDQIWGKIGTEEFDKAYFLDFLPEGKKCIAYSASFGKEKICAELDNRLNSLLDKYQSLMLREQSAVDIVKKHGFENAHLVLDPTLLLEREEWDRLTTKNRIKSKYVLVYQLHDNKEFDKYAREFAKNKKMKLIRISPSFHNFFRSGKLIWLPNPEEFITLFANAEYVLTDSFHATVFSLIFEKKFIDILPKDTNTRILNILDISETKDRVLKSYTDFDTADKNIDFEKVNAKLNDARNKSILLLKKAIDGGESLI